MVIHFFDTSALVKHYVPEKGTRKVRRLVDDARADPGGTRLYLSRIAFPESISAVTRRRHRGTITEGEGKTFLHAIYRDFTSPTLFFTIVEASAVIVDQAALLVAQHKIRGFDAVHLAAALSTQRFMRPPDRFFFVTSDLALAQAAQAAGVATLDPTT
jgi:uncharacterized protein